MNRTISSADETFLVTQARNGDESAWEQLVQSHQDAVFRLAYLITGNADDAQDVAQGVFIRAYMKLDQYDDGRPLRPWLLGITANLARNQRRTIGRYWRAVQRYFIANDRELDLPALDERMESQILWQAIRKLPQIYQVIIYLRFFLELSEAETAESLEIARGTVKSRSHRALKKLQQIIEDEYPEIANERTFN
ncbi:MAG: RNA polymerase sigma factor [Candidatus Promineifilaceae bacterium]|nr:RNA polymerase sigma factor [Candidatus Promineifilaceae bacterium]